MQSNTHKYRIVKSIYTDGTIQYQIQRKKKGFTFSLFWRNCLGIESDLKNAMDKIQYMILHDNKMSNKVVKKEIIK